MQRQSLLGSKYFEHFNDEGKKVGESRERAGVFGKYIEHCDATGKKVGESRERAGLFGRFVEHTDATGRKTGKSVKRRSLFGDYTEHRDTSGQVVGKSKPVHNITGLGRGPDRGQLSDDPWWQHHAVHAALRGCT